MTTLPLRRLWPLFAVLLGSAAFDSLLEEDLRCENLVVELVDCCPDLDPTAFFCDYDSGCASPSFSTTELSCLEDMECDELRSKGICDRLPRATSSGLADEELPEAPLCVR